MLLIDEVPVQLHFVKMISSQFLVKPMHTYHGPYLRQMEAEQLVFSQIAFDLTLPQISPRKQQK